MIVRFLMTLALVCLASWMQAFFLPSAGVAAPPILFLALIFSARRLALPFAAGLGIAAGFLLAPVSLESPAALVSSATAAALLARWLTDHYMSHRSWATTGALLFLCGIVFWSPVAVRGLFALLAGDGTALAILLAVASTILASTMLGSLLYFPVLFLLRTRDARLGRARRTA